MLKKLLSMVIILMLSVTGTGFAEKTDVDFKENATIIQYASDENSIRIDGNYNEGLVRIKKEVPVYYVVSDKMNAAGQREVAWGHKMAYRYGFMDKAGNIVIECKYSFTTNFTDGRAFVGIVNDDFKGSTMKEYLDSQSSPDFVYIDKNEQITYRLPKYTKVKSGSLNDNGVDYFEFISYKDGVIRNQDKKTGKYGLLDVDGNRVGPCKYQYIGTFFEGKALAQYNDEFVIINNKGEMLFKTPFTAFDGSGLSSYDSNFYGQGYRDGVLRGHNDNNEVGLIDDKGNLIVEFGRYDSIEFANEDRCIVGNIDETLPEDWYDRHVYGVIDTAGNELVAPKYQVLRRYTGGRAIAYPDKTTDVATMLDENGSELFEPRAFLELHNCIEGLVNFRVENGYKDSYGNHTAHGYLDRDGNIQVSTTYQFATSYENGYAAVRLFGDDPRVEAFGLKATYLSTYMIDKNNEIVFDAQLNYIGEDMFYAGNYLVMFKEKAVQ